MKKRKKKKLKVQQLQQQLYHNQHLVLEVDYLEEHKEDKMLNKL